MSFQVKLPEDFFFEIAEHLQGFITDDLAYFIAQIGTGVGPDAYSKIPQTMLKKPVGLKGAYEQAYFFTVLAAQRAIRLEDEHQIPFGSARVFFSQLVNLSKQVILADQDVAGPMCDTLGMGCSLPSGPAILRSTMNLVENSALPQADKDAIVGFVRHNRNALVLQQTLPWIALLGLGGLLVSGIGYRRRVGSTVIVATGPVSTAE